MVRDHQTTIGDWLLEWADSVSRILKAVPSSTYVPVALRSADHVPSDWKRDVQQRPELEQLATACRSTISRILPPDCQSFRASVIPVVRVLDSADTAKSKPRPRLPALPVWGPSAEATVPADAAKSSPLRLNSFSRSELVEQVGMTDNNLTLWIRHGLIQPHGERSGRGNALRYPFYEANMAAILLHLHRFGASIETMKGIAGIYRAALAWGLSFGLTPDVMVIITSLLHEPIWVHAKIKKDTGKFDPRAFSQAVHKHEAKFGLSSNNPRPASRKAARAAQAQAAKDDRLVSPVLIEFVERVDFDEWKLHASAFYDLLLQPRALTLPCPVFFWNTGQGWRRGESTEGQLVASERDGSYVTIAIDTLGVFYHLWNKGESIARRDVNWGDLIP